MLNTLRTTLLLLATALFTQGGITLAQDLPPDIGDDFKYSKPSKKLTGRIAFTSKIGAYERLLVLDVESGSVYPVVTGPGNARYPAWNSTGNQLVFTSDRTGENKIHRANWDGNRQILLKTPHGAQGHPDIVGRDLFFYQQERNATNIYSGKSWKGGEVKVTDFTGRNITPRMSPKRDYLAYSTNRFWPGWDICLWDIKYKIETCPLKGETSFCRPAWHKSGKKFLYATGEGKDIDIGIYDLEEKTSRILTNLPNREYDPVWSPDFKSFAFVAEPKELNQFQLYVLIDGNSKPELILSGPYPIRYLAWHKTPTLKLEAQRLRDLDEKATQKRDNKKETTRKSKKKKPKKSTEKNSATDPFLAELDSSSTTE